MAILQLQNYALSGTASTACAVTYQYLEHDYTIDSNKVTTRNILNVIQPPTLEFAGKGNSYQINTSISLSGYRVKRIAVATIYSDNKFHHYNIGTTDFNNLQTNNTFTVQDSIIVTYYCAKT